MLNLFLEFPKVIHSFSLLQITFTKENFQEPLIFRLHTASFSRTDVSQ